MTIVILLACLANLTITSALFFKLLKAGTFTKSKRLSSIPPTKEAFAEAVADVKGILDETTEWLEIEKAARRPKPIHP
jgi:hypothetical protein